MQTNNIWDVIVVGLGTTGTQAIYHLANANVTNILGLE
jgi:ribulose 1,5-bisphosphate synthetase/thiazole synthase